jgi:hypothetical protein
MMPPGLILLAWAEQLINGIGGMPVYLRLVTVAMFGAVFWGLAGALIVRFRYEIVYGLAGLLILYWIISAFR